MTETGRTFAAGERRVIALELPDNLIDVLAERVRQIVRSELASAHSEPPLPWLNVRSAAAYLDTTPDAVYGLIKRGELIHHHSSNGRLLFRREDLDAHARGEDA